MVCHQGHLLLSMTRVSQYSPLRAKVVGGLIVIITGLQESRQVLQLGCLVVHVRDHPPDTVFRFQHLGGQCCSRWTCLRRCRGQVLFQVLLQTSVVGTEMVTLAAGKTLNVMHHLMHAKLKPVQMSTSSRLARQ